MFSRQIPIAVDMAMLSKLWCFRVLDDGGGRYALADIAVALLKSDYPQEKLAILQRLDQFRHWHSLDEKRYCLVCGEMITGRQIQVIMAHLETGRCASFVRQNIVMRCRWNGCSQPTTS